MQGEGGRCFSRAEPRHKQDIVRLLKEMGEVGQPSLCTMITPQPFLQAHVDIGQSVRVILLKISPHAPLATFSEGAAALNRGL